MDKWVYWFFECSFNFEKKSYRKAIQKIKKVWIFHRNIQYFIEKVKCLKTNLMGRKKKILLYIVPGKSG